MTPAEIDTLLQEVHNLRMVLIDVGTGTRRINDAETDYTSLRSTVAAKLQRLAMVDTNDFVSLWDWYSYWKANGLSSYQSRREYINSLYKPVVSGLDRIKSAVTAKPAEAAQTFSVRHRYTDDQSAVEITIREDAPEELRAAIVNIAERTGWKCDDLLSIALRTGKKSWEPTAPLPSQMSSSGLLRYLMSQWEWFYVYDFIEQLYDAMKEWQVPDNPEANFERMLNEYFRHVGVGWELQNGTIVSRGSEAFETALHRAAPSLQEAGLQAAERQIHEAIADLSRRPHADITGAVQHAMAALECVARSISGDSSQTLGKILERHPGLIPKPLDIAVEKAWGYASERGRHIREGGEPSREEAELIVGISATVATYLAHKGAIQ